MVSEAVQTSFHKRDCPRHGTASTVKRQSEKHPAGAFTPETSDLSGENVAPARRAERAVTGDRSEAKAGQCKCIYLNVTPFTNMLRLRLRVLNRNKSWLLYDDNVGVHVVQL